MSMPADEPTLGEVARTLERFADDTRTRFSELTASIGLMVTRDLYEAHRTAMQEDIAQLRDEQKTGREQAAANRRMVVGALIGAALSLIITIVGAALVAAFGLGG